MSARKFSSSRLMRGAVVLLASGALTVALEALSADQPKGPSPAQQQIKYRQALYTVLASNAGPIFAMASGKMPYDAAALSKRAERVNFVAGILPEAFPAGSDAGAPTRALPKIWKDRADFDQLMQDLSDKAAALLTAAKTNDWKQIQPSVGALGDACKACHDKYKKKEEQPSP
jgi:cytochrome c556